jgi:FkbH-like protein
MKLIEAMEMIRTELPAGTPAFRVCLVSGFSPLHLQTFLNAELRKGLPKMRPEISVGIYGDFWGNLKQVEGKDADVCAVVMEWADLDPRLGLRNLGSWSPDALSDILNNARTRGAEFLQNTKTLSKNTALAISFPTLPLPPASFAQGWQANTFDLELKSITSSLSLEAARCPNVKVVNSDRLDRTSPIANRYDVKSELTSGFPYTLPHASAVAEMLRHAIQPSMPKKGLITDLDDTLWSGILGEVGAEGISWDLDHHSHMHGAYQRMLHSLAEAGVLVGAASKNSADVVEEALQRDDLVLPRNSLFPVEADWGRKSESVSRILKLWNIGADSVVFIDDSPMELAEVKAEHPEIECILFPREDPRAVSELLYTLRDFFGKAVLSEEDSLRRESIRTSHELHKQNESQPGSADDFLRQSDAELTLSFTKEPLDPRALELVNKTNQFNLNGKRFTDSTWKDFIERPDTVFVMASYRDKYGRLGKIAVLAGKKKAKEILLNVWVMSCRAFSRRIEHRCLQELFERFDVDHIEFEFERTSRNGPTEEFLSSILGEAPTPERRLSRGHFMKSSIETFQKVLEVTNG